MSGVTRKIKVCNMKIFDSMNDMLESSFDQALAAMDRCLEEYENELEIEELRDLRESLASKYAEVSHQERIRVSDG